MNGTIASIDEVILTVFGDEFDRTTGVKRRRLQQVETNLRAFLEATEVGYLTADERTLLAAEQEFAPAGAFCRALNAEVLLAALTAYLTPPHLAADHLLRQVQLNMAEALLGYVVDDVLRDYDTSCIRMDLHWALVEARKDLNRERRARSAARRLARMTEQERSYLELEIRNIEERSAPKPPTAAGMHTPDSTNARDPHAE